MYKVTDPDGRVSHSRYSDADILKEAARLSRSTGNKNGPLPKTAASIVKWIKWNDRDAEVGHLRNADMEDAMFALRQYLTDADMAGAVASNPKSRKLDSPEKALRVLAAAHGYELVKKNPPRTRKNPGCSCGGKCAPCASRKNRRRKAAR